ncbi:LOW QUALITY PROTEIN: histone-lysine N-methyltransferase EZA1 isoform X3 [Populus alba x Populus x berolinensis]|uniref:[histone H3]-lysine(27) N-trimethyltransferase n=1 Tax=Populus alba x Populus x berolinensis TaxID=444605 RepID=A0AAD6RFN4_9ROSI|nr:LOW QUALITY PROTEIN: histone-lysine N-methyltransferase EZA1 isoform X3 [Populus alba x Populus x berolinensis]
MDAWHLIDGQDSYKVGHASTTYNVPRVNLVSESCFLLLFLPLIPLLATRFLRGESQSSGAMSRSSDSASKFRKSDGEPSNNGVGNLTSKMNQLKRQIQAERVVSIKDKVEKNRRKLEADVSQLRLATSRTFMGQNGISKMISLRIGTPLCKYGGFAQGSGDKDVINGHEVAATTGTKLPFVEKIPPYTTWIFLDKNQRMAEDQSVVGRRRIYYDQHGSEALICSDSEEDNEPEEEKHEFCDGEDRILWMVSQEHGLAEEVLNVVSQFIGVGTTEIQERCRMLEEKYSGDQSIKDTSDSVTGRGISMEKSLSTALDSFDNLFCRRCLLFDCRLHGCSQTLINPSEKQSYWSEYEDDRKPCSNQCSLRLRVVKDLPGGSVNRTKTATSTEEKKTAAASDAEGPSGVDFMIDEESITEKEMSVISEAFCNLEPASGPLNLDMSAMVIHNQEYMRKRKAPQHTDIAPDGSSQAPDDMQDFSKKKKRLLHLDIVNEAAEGVFPDHGSTAKKASDKIELKMTIKKTTNDSFETVCSGTEENVGHGAKDVLGVPRPKQPSTVDRAAEGVLRKSEWKPIEKELYLKGVEIFGKNSCLIARNLLSGLKTCIEVSNYMRESGAMMPHRSVAPRSFLEDSGKSDTDYVDYTTIFLSLLCKGNHLPQLISSLLSFLEKIAALDKRRVEENHLTASLPPSVLTDSIGVYQYPFSFPGSDFSSHKLFLHYKAISSIPFEQDMPTRSRLLRRRGRARKLKYSWKSAGHPSFWKRIADGKNQSCKQFTPCGCQSMCGKQCPCLHNGTCCEKYCGCSKSCKNRFRGCHCAKSQCRSRQCPCFAAGRECDPDVCRNCWVSCGDGSLGEPPKRGDGQCGNMRLLLRQQQRILLAKSDVAGWGAFLKFVLDAYRKGDKLKFANHSSNPNCYAKVMLVAGDHRVGIFAKEHIEACEELFYDYRYGPDQAPAWARKPEGSKRDDSTISQGAELRKKTRVFLGLMCLSTHDAQVIKALLKAIETSSWG